MPNSLVSYEDGQAVYVIGTVYAIEPKGDYTNIYIELMDDSKLIVMDVNENFVEIGNTIEVSGNLMEYDVARNPGNFDSKEYYHNQGIYASIYLQKMKVIDSTKDNFRQYLFIFRQNGIVTLNELLGEKNGPLLSAMIFGDKSQMDEEQKERFQKVGISHIFAISGLHISLLCMATYSFIRKRTGSFLIGGILGTGILISYIIVTGISISAIRAGVMFVVRIVGDITGRVYDTRTSLGIAGIWILMDTKTYLFDGGFLLSFGAILGVVYLLPVIKMLLKNYGALGSMLSASLAIQIVLLPIMFQNFYEVCLYAIFMNLVVIPCMPVLLIAGILGLCCFDFVPIIGKLFFCICGFVLEVVDKLSLICIQLPYSRLVLGKIWWPIIILYYILLILLIYWGSSLCKKEEYLEEYFGKPLDVKDGITRDREYSILEDRLRVILWKWKLTLSTLLIMLPLLLLIDKPAADLSLTMIDVGQGDSIFISGPTGGTYLVDGGSTDISNVGRYRIESYLLSRGVKCIDYVFISHGDADHYNGIEEMLKRQTLGVKIKYIVLSEEAFLDNKLRNLAAVAQNNDVKVLLIHEGDKVMEKELEFTCIAPKSNYTGEIGNASSMVLDVSYMALDILFTGDLEGTGEKDFIAGAYNLKDSYDILKVSHHGSKNSTPIEFLELVNPKICIVSAGVGSRYGHPHTELIERLEEYTENI